jgi:uncharacterized membrane protein
MPIGATLYDWLVFAHVLGAMIWLGGSVAVSVLAANIVRRGDRDAIERFIGSLGFVGPLVFAPATLAVLGFGIWLVLDSDAWDFGQTWVWFALVLFGAAFVVGAAFQSRAAIGAGRAAAAGNDREAARQLARWSWGSRVILLLLVVATWDMVFKPGV